MDRVKSTRELEKDAPISTNKLNISGRLFIDVRVRSPNGFFTDEIGEASGNIRREYARLKAQAKLNAVYKHINRGGRSGAVVVKVYRVWFRYFKEGITSKRVVYKKKIVSGKKKGKFKGSYRIITRDKKGRIVSNVAWSSKQEDEDVRETDVFAFK